MTRLYCDQVMCLRSAVASTARSAWTWEVVAELALAAGLAVGALALLQLGDGEPGGQGFVQQVVTGNGGVDFGLLQQAHVGQEDGEAPGLAGAGAVGQPDARQGGAAQGVLGGLAQHQRFGRVVEQASGRYVQGAE